MFSFKKPTWPFALVAVATVTYSLLLCSILCSIRTKQKRCNYSNVHVTICLSGCISHYWLCRIQFMPELIKLCSQRWRGLVCVCAEHQQVCLVCVTLCTSLRVNALQQWQSHLLGVERLQTLQNEWVQREEGETESKMNVFGNTEWDLW